MLIKDYLKLLGKTALRNTSAARFATASTLGNLPDYGAVTGMMQEALDRLYSRFILVEKHILVKMQQGRFDYPLREGYSVNEHDASLVTVPYIIDTPQQKFTGDIIKILNVVTTERKIMPLNDQGRLDGVFTLQHDVLQNPTPVDGEILSIAYQAAPPNVAIEPFDSAVPIIEFYLPSFLYPAMTAYVAYLFHNSISTPEAMAVAMNNLRMYEEICREAERMDLLNQSQSNTNVRFDQAGWK